MFINEIMWFNRWKSILINHSNFKNIKVNWIDCFIEDCHILSKTYNWAKEMPNLLKKFKGFPDDYYQSEIPIVLLKTNGNFYILSKLNIEIKNYL